MAELTPLQRDRDAWCRERLDFFCAVINDVDRESLKAQLDECETEDDAAGLMHSLLWLQDNMTANYSDVAAAAAAAYNHEPIDNPPGPQTNQVHDDDQYFALPTNEHVFQEHQGVLYDKLNDFPENSQYQQEDIFLPFNHHSDLEQNDITRDRPFVSYVQNQPEEYPSLHKLVIPIGEQQMLNSENQETETKAEVVEPQIEKKEHWEQEPGYQEPRVSATADCFVLRVIPPTLVTVNNRRVHERIIRNMQEPEILDVHKQSDSHNTELFEDIPHREEETENEYSLGDLFDEVEEVREDVTLDDNKGERDSDLGIHDLFSETGDDVDEEFMAVGGRKQDTEVTEPISERSDPYFDAEENFEEQDEEDTLSLDDYSTAVVRYEENEAVARDEDEEYIGAIGGRSNDDTKDDERLAYELLEAMDAEERKILAEDERLARELAEQMELEERQRMEEDEALARRISEINEVGKLDRRGNEPPVDIIFAEELDKAIQTDDLDELEERANAMARVVMDAEEEDEMVRRLQQEEVLHEMREEEDEKAGRVAALISMFPDADPTYLEECIVNVETEEAFRGAVEELLLRQRTEPRMQGYQRLMKQGQGGYGHDDDDQEAGPSNAVATVGAAADLKFECTICFEEEVPFRLVATCNSFDNYHGFCIECIRKHVGALIGQGHSRFKCMNGYCQSEFSWRTLRRVMEPVVYRKIQERRQQEEVMAAGVENLVSCPFCCFMIIMPDPENKVLECLNPECLKESCRLCKEPSHIPLRCEEVERDNQKDARTMLENKMAEAMIRQCPRCTKRFVTEGGCNKMTCSCGTVMCYLCKAVITNGYDHFEQRGGVVSNKCPLWSNSQELHTGEVREAAVQGREEIDPDLTLLHDPTRDLNLP